MQSIHMAAGAIQIDNVDELTLKQNVLFSGKGVVTGVHLKDYSAAGRGPLEADDTNILADPRLLDYKSGRIRFAPDSCVRSLGIPDLDVSNAGRLPRP